MSEKQWIIMFTVFQLDPRIIQPFLADCRDTIAKLDNQNMKAIKGLEDRLYALDQMIASCKKLVNEQKELAQVTTSNLNHFFMFVKCGLQVSCFFIGIFGQSETG